MKSQGITGSNRADGIVWRKGEILFYGRYYPVEHPFCFKVGRLSAAGHLKWSGAAPREGSWRFSPDAWRFGHDTWAVDRATTFPYVLAPGPGMSFNYGRTVGRVHVGDTWKWGMRTQMSSPTPSTIVTGPKGGLYVDPRYEPPEKVYRRKEDGTVWFEPMMDFVHDQADRMIVRRCADGVMYVWQFRLFLGLQNFFRFEDGKPESGFTLRDLCGYHDVCDFDVSPDGRTLAVGYVGPTADPAVTKDYTYERRLSLYDLTDDGAVHKVSYSGFHAEHLAFSPDGLTLAMAGNPYSVRGKCLESLTVIDVE